MNATGDLILLSNTYVHASHVVDVMAALEVDLEDGWVVVVTLDDGRTVSSASMEPDGVGLTGVYRTRREAEGVARCFALKAARKVAGK